MSAESFPTKEGRRTGPLLTAVLIFGAFVGLLILFANVWTDWLWYDNLEAGVVFTTLLGARIGLFFSMGLLMAALIAGNMLLAYRLRPKVRVSTTSSALIARFRDLLDYRRWVVIALPAGGLGLLAGLAAAANAETFLAWLNGMPFGVEDPYFGMDASFFVFGYPLYRIVVSFLVIGLVVTTVTSAFMHFVTGAISVQSFRRNAPVAKNPAAQAHVSVLAGLALVAYGVSLLLDRVAISVQPGRQFTGVHYTDATARIPALLIMACIVFVCAVVFFVNAWLRRWPMPGTAVVLAVIAGLILNGIYPWWVQTFDVNPNEPDKERPYITNNLTATRAAFGIDHLELEDYKAVATVSAGQLRADAEALPAIRLIDPAVVAPTFEQLQQVRGYYAFPDRLDVDRYTIDGNSTDAVVAARELNISGISEANWNNIHTVYTHGYGLVAAYGSKRQSNGEPQFMAGEIPTVGQLAEHEPRIYFGERATHYVVVGAPEGADPIELDTPGGGAGGSETKYTYAGKGGIPVGGFFNRALFSIRLADMNLLLTDRVNPASRILLERTPLDRVQKVAPWLLLDSDVYPTVVDGRIQWVVDGYTTSSFYPNSTQVDWRQAASDDPQIGRQQNLASSVNYVRNAVKATVDAYDGSVKLYAWDESDPILQTWQKVYPGTVQPKSSISADLLKHLRFPQDLFKVQRHMLGRYHTTNPHTWFQRSDVWETPADPKLAAAASSAAPQQPGQTAPRSGDQKEPPYYLTIKWPGDSQPVFSQTAVFVPLGRQNLSVYLAVNSDASSKDYGRLRVLKLSDSQQIAGPAQTFNAIQTEGKVAEQLLPFTRQGSTRTIFGNLLTLPVGGGLLYVQPIYTQINKDSNGGAYPALRFVAVRFGEHVGIGSTLQQALDQVFQGDSGAKTGENPITEPPPGQAPTPGAPAPNPTTAPSPAPGSVPSGSAAPQPAPSTSAKGPEAAKKLLAEAETLFGEADAALKAGDLANYQAKQNAAKDKVVEAMKALA